jgi:hypothetical protein
MEECLAEAFESGALALQDTTNEIGARSGFNVTPGRYRGAKGSVGNDGLWHADDGFSVLVEVKTTDAYRINLDTLAGYRDSLTASSSIDPQRCSILIVVGREDTGDLEAQIRGSRHAWDIRLISLDALLRLAEVKEELSDWDTSNKINQLLRPVEYTRLDGIVELLFATKKDLEITSIAPPAEIKKASKPIIQGTKDLETARDSAVSRIGEQLKCAFVRRSRALRASSDGSVRLVCLASQRYEGPAGSGNYWFGFTPAQRDFLLQANSGWVSMVCADTGRAFLVKLEDFMTWLPELWTTPPAPVAEEDIRHWHVYFNDYGSRVDLMKAGGGLLRDISKYLI